jgi:hypothetical protein
MCKAFTLTTLAGVKLQSHQQQLVWEEAKRSLLHNGKIGACGDNVGSLSINDLYFTAKFITIRNIIDQKCHNVNVNDCVKHII